jgi:AcrR family transcriptional regulator
MATNAPKKPRRLPIQERAQATVDVIVEAAARVLADIGPKALTTNRIAARAGVSIGSLYQYFTSKEAILVAIARAQLAHDRDVMRTTIAGTRSLDQRARVRAVVRALIALHRADAGVRRVAMSSHLDQGLAGEHEQGVRAATELLAESDPVFQRLPEAARFVLTHAILGVVRTAYRENLALLDDLQLEDELVRLAEALLSATRP